jgi:decaprenyl-phosphate phosphoribosyltransferase
VTTLDVEDAKRATGEGTIMRHDRGTWWSYVRLARLHQWLKGVFVLIGPLYGLKDLTAKQQEQWWEPLTAGLLAFLAFGFASSACYVVNDLHDVEADRMHPRKRNRPLASGAVSRGGAIGFAVVLLLGAAGAVVALPEPVRLGVAAVVGAYVVNVFAYSLKLKHMVIADVLSLALGFVLRMFGGCAAVGIAPTTWLLNVTFFLAMFLAFGKRLGERRVMGADAASARGVQAVYTDELLRMVVVVTAVATLVTYAGYVQAKELEASFVMWPFLAPFNFLWFTMVPAIYALMRAIVLLERGRYDDPTELAVKDRPMQVAVLAFMCLTAGVLGWKLWAP